MKILCAIHNQNWHLKVLIFHRVHSLLYYCFCRHLSIPEGEKQVSCNRHVKPALNHWLSSVTHTHYVVSTDTEITHLNTNGKICMHAHTQLTFLVECTHCQLQETHNRSCCLLTEVSLTDITAAYISTRTVKLPSTSP